MKKKSVLYLFPSTTLNYSTPMGIARAVEDSGWEVSVVFGGSIEGSNLKKQSFLVTSVLPILNRLEVFRVYVMLFQVMKWARKNPQGVIHVKNSKLAALFPLMLRFFFPGVIFFLDVRSAATGGSLRQGFRNRITKISRIFFHDTFVVSLDIGHFLFKDNRFTVLSPGYDRCLFAPAPKNLKTDRLRKEHEGCWILYHGKVNKKRPLDELLYFARNLDADNKRIKLVLLVRSDGLTKEDKEALVKKTQASESALDIDLRFDVPYEDIPRFIIQSDFVLGYLPEEMPYRLQPSLKVIEALACGTEVIANATVAHRRLSRSVRGIHLLENVNGRRKHKIPVSDRNLNPESLNRAVLDYSFHAIAQKVVIPAYEHKLRQA